MQFGRKVLYTDIKEINAGNILQVLQGVYNDFTINSNDINYLYDYYKGKQPILYREKQVRPEINNKIVINHANEIVSFKVGYLCGEPIQYVGRIGDEDITRNINKLNELMFAENKAKKDKEIVEWQMICGTAYRMALPNLPNTIDEAPFDIYTLDPRNTFVIYANDIASKPVAGGTVIRDVNNKQLIKEISVYTNNMYYHIVEGKLVDASSHSLGMMPIIEYPANNARQGVFEIVIDLLNAINELESNRMDGVEQFVQSFLKFINCDVTMEDFEALKELGAIKVKSVEGSPNADVELVTSELNQDQTQTLSQNLYNTVLLICGVPSISSGNTSDSSNNGAVILKNGWQSAEARAKDSEIMFKDAEHNFLKLVLKICHDSYVGDKDIDETINIELHLRDIECKFTRRNYEDIQSKSTVLTTMLNNSKIHPLLAFEHCGMFSDPDNAYAMSMEYYEEQISKIENEMDEDE